MATDSGACRYFVARDTSGFIAEARAVAARGRATHARHGGGPTPPLDMLAISGGGDDGAFGAGLLVGWSEAGTRPEFQVVTGISTGALAAPFAFLGPSHDGDLKAVYTEITQRDIFTPRGFLAALNSDAMADTAPLRRMLERHVTRALMDEIAAEYVKGRLLLVGTTDLDAREPVIWNLTAIAASHSPNALPLFRKVLLASAAIPGAFPPVMIDVDANGERYQEMHVDGGAVTQVFLYPPTLRIADEAAAMGVHRHRSLFVIRNSRLDPDWTVVKRSTLPIASRAVSSLMATQGIGDIYRIYLLADRDDIDFNLAYIPGSFVFPKQGQFDQAYMQALFNRGRDMALAGYPWQKYPPGYERPIKSTAR
jgi:predicted acylesterase/phospholipase RssA